MKYPYLKFYVIFLTFIYLMLQICLVNMFSINTIIFINVILVGIMVGKIWELHEKCKEKDKIIITMGYRIINLYKKLTNKKIK